MDKAALASQLTNAKNNYVLGMAAISFFGSPEAYPILQKNKAVFGNYTVKFDQVVRLLQKESDRDIAIREFLTSQIRAIIKESFELIKDYCHDTGQNAIFKDEPWYQFARMIRNCLSHNFKFEFNRYDHGLLPVSWNGRTITIDMDSHHLKLDFFGYVETWELFMEYDQFVKNRLK
jgi:hypothetical protein